MANKKAKRYTDAQKQEILDFIDSQGRGGQTKAVKKYKVTAATISSWRKKSGGGTSVGSGRSTGGSKELQALQELTALLTEIESLQAKLTDLQKRYKKAKRKV